MHAQHASSLLAMLGLPLARCLPVHSYRRVTHNGSGVLPAAQCLEPRLLLAGREELTAQLRSKPVGSWMWDGKTMNDALKEFAAAGMPKNDVM